MSLSRRALLCGALSTGTLGWGLSAGTTATAATTTGSHYATPEAFDEVMAAFLADEYQNNETGGYAWGEAYAMLGVMRMYEAYRDRRYLDLFVSRAEHVWATTDARREVTDYRGRSGPVWRAGGNYTASHADLTDDSGQPVVQLRWAGTRPTEATVTVSAGQVPGTYDLSLTHPRAGTREVRGVNNDPSSPNYAVPRVNAVYALNARWTAKTPTGAATDAVPANGTFEFARQYYVYAVHTGMVTYSIAMFCRVVLDDPALARSRYGGTARRYLAHVRRAVAFHDDEFLVDEQGFGDYVWPKGAPVPFDGLIQPYNQTHGLGQTMAELHRIDPGAGYGRKVEAMVTGLRAGLSVDADGAYVWNYWAKHGELYRGYAAAEQLSEYTPWYNAVRTIEDISHAAITTEFLVAAHEAGLTVTEQDLRRFGATYVYNVVRDDGAWRRVNGTTVASNGVAVQCARWISLAPWQTGIVEHSVALYDAVALTPRYGSHVLGIAYLNWGTRSGWN